MSYAIVKNNVVENIVEWDGKAEFNVDGELIEITSDTRIGGSWDGNVFSFYKPILEDVRTYAEKRKVEYPSIEECVHAILDDQLDALQVKRQAVKSKYPKG